MRKAFIYFVLALVSFSPLPFTHLEAKMTTDTQTQVAPVEQAVIYFAGGCFWGVEEYFSAFQAYSTHVRVMPMGIQKTPRIVKFVRG